MNSTAFKTNTTDPELIIITQMFSTKMVSLANVIYQIHCKEYQNYEGRTVSTALCLNQNYE